MAKKPASTPDLPKPNNGFGKIYGLFRERWPEYVIEIIVIIFSITISFAVDEWKDRQQKKELEQIYLKGLYSDIRTDINQLSEVSKETQQVIQKARRLSEQNPKTPIVDYNQFLADVRFVFKRPRFIAEDATFSDLKSTGNLQVISSFPLKSLLFDYYRHYESSIQVENAELETTNAIIGPYLLKRFPLAGGNDNVLKINLTTVRSEVEYQNAMLVRRSTREELLHDYEQSIKLGKQILAAIKPQLK